MTPDPRHGADVQVLLVEGSPVLRERLAGLVGELPGVALGGSPDSDVAALAAAEALAYDAVVLDVDRSPFDMVARLRAAAPGAVLVVLGADGEPDLRDRCLALGADFFFRTHPEFERVRGVLLDLAARRASAPGSPSRRPPSQEQRQP